jgi:hypothetical protein
MVTSKSMERRYKIFYSIDQLSDVFQESRPGLLLKPGDIYHANPQLVKRFLSSHFHAKHHEFYYKARTIRDQARRMAWIRRGKNPDDLAQTRPPQSHLWEINPYEPVHLQTDHAIFQFLDKQARKEERWFRKNEQFIPKPFMAANVFLPAYLEVSYRSCTGCFVRKPHIKKDGLMEVPSPYPADVHHRAGMYYSKYGRRDDISSGYGKYKLFWNKRKVRT